MRIRHVTGWALGLGVLIAGCQENASGPPDQQNVLVQVTASASHSGTAIFLAKVSGTSGIAGAVDSLRVDEAILVLKDIAFKAAIDSEHVRDSLEMETEDRDDDGDEIELTTHGGYGNRVHFKGPFVVALKDTTPVQIAVDTIPPGTYTGIKFILHKLRAKDIARNPALPDSLLGYSVVVTGSAKYAGGSWAPFTFKSDINEEFKTKGEFMVSPGEVLTPFVLKFDLGSWFRGYDGRILDPNSSMDRWFIRSAIKTSLKGHVRCGRDRNRDGHPD